MRLDPAVARRKFEREVSRVEAQRATLRRWGCHIADATYPHVDVIFLSHKPLRTMLSIDPDLAKGRARQARRKTQNVLRVDLHLSAARAFGVRVDLRDFDQRAPGVSFHDPFTWDPLPFDRLPPGHHFDGHGTALRVVLDVHPLTKGPFLCMRGIREYHEHPQHSGDEWALYRRDFGLFTVLHTVWRTCVEHLRLHLIPTPNGVPKFLWQVEQAV